ncbi:hypothetical protein KXW25_004665, partial [Aspergillus fumigatus]
MRQSLYHGAIWFALASLASADAPSSQQWAERAIYQVMTDRFARPAGSSDAPCDPERYCGGSWTGIIDKLDYIQDLGFTAIQCRLKPSLTSKSSSTVPRRQRCF